MNTRAIALSISAFLAIAAGCTSKKSDDGTAPITKESALPALSIRDDTPADEFLLARYVVTCCVADATIAEVRVVNVTPGQFSNEDWVRVRGTIYPLGREVIVNASDVTSVARPDHPYLTP